jgi:predicted DNA-binding protein
MKTALSVPNQVFEQADKLAKRLNKTRSQLYTEAMVEYLTRHDPDTVTDRLNDVADSVAEGDDRFVTETGRSILQQVDW